MHRTYLILRRIGVANVELARQVGRLEAFSLLAAVLVFSLFATLQRFRNILNLATHLKSSSMPSYGPYKDFKTGKEAVDAAPKTGISVIIVGAGQLNRQ